MTSSEFILVVLLSFGLTVLILRPFYRKAQKSALHTKEREKQLTQELYKQVRTTVRHHKTQLAIQRRKSVVADAYGKEDNSNWLWKEVPYFIEHHLLPKLSSGAMEAFPREEFSIIQLIDSFAKNTKIPKTGYSSKMDGFQFEAFCSAKLASEGWKVSKTPSGTDQGVDLIIEKGNRKIAIQCKKHGRPIGNKAVQEVKAGLQHYGISDGAVLTNSTFTKSAQSLAASNHINLLHYLETPKI